MASDVEFQHGREMNMLELLCHLVKRISFLAKLVRLALQNVEFNLICFHEIFQNFHNL